jgi:DNA-binding GntR family transcriptional regulator
VCAALYRIWRMTEVAGPVVSRFLTKEELVARHIRQSIAAGRLAPGQRLLQKQIAEELGISPTPVREALRGLVTEGWLTSESHIGVSVAQVNKDGIDEIYRLRALLEGDLAAEAAKRITSQELGEIRLINSKYRQAANAEDLADARAANLQFHAAIWEAANSPFAVNLLNSLWARVPRPAAGVVKDRHQKTVAEHENVIAALASGNPDRAREALNEHIRSGQVDYHRSFDQVGQAPRQTPADEADNVEV